MSSARRPLLTATAAGTLLGALWFVPSANASQNSPAASQPSTTASAQAATQARTMSATTTDAADDAAVGTATGDGTEGTRLADTGSFDTTPYTVGGTLCLAMGVGFVAYAVRRERLGF
ncbi:hypothetical protein [Streptomyces sp. NPDC059378]|uniref:hypothetical protein n=1 Tax=Streptomyces sp. NPDC059378 TaxID=3346815 RepID=UPI00369A30FE